MAGENTNKPQEMVGERKWDMRTKRELPFPGVVSEDFSS
jgi:hypothetical protein